MARKFSFHHLLIGLLIVAASGLSSFAAETIEKQDRPIRFAVLGDRTGEPHPGVYGAIVAEVARMRPDFVITPGDLIVGYTNDTVTLQARWEEYVKLIQPLEVPLYIAPGNHDITMDGMLASYCKYVGKPYRSADFEDIHLIMLDNSRWEASDQLPAEQIEWLADDLAKNTGAAYTIVLYHKPFWYETTARGIPDTLHSLFVGYGVDAVFSGHYHDYFAGEYDGIKYTTVGSSGGGMVPGPTGIGYHFLWVTVDSKGIHIAPIDAGSVRPWNEVEADERLVFSPIRRAGMVCAEPLLIAPTNDTDEGEISVILKNSLSEYTLDDTLRWETPEGWFIDPMVMPVQVPGGEDGTFKFAVRRDGPIYPVPTMSAKFTYAEGKQVPVGGNLWVSREVACSPVNSSPTIDGDLSEKCWQQPQTYYYNPDGTDMKIDPFRFYFAYDKDNLYLAAHCDDAMIDSIRATVTEHDGPIYSEDCVGYFIEPVHGSDTVYQIYFNPLGSVFDQLCYRGDDGWMRYDRDWNGEYEAKTVRGDDFWSIEVRIPLAQLGATAEAGQEWRLNFRRKQKRFDGAANWLTPIDADPTTMGVMILSQP